MLPLLAVCETGTWSGCKWHLRELTDQGLKFGGGADTRALCGAEVKWDLDIPPEHPGVDWVTVPSLSRTYDSPGFGISGSSR